MNPIDTNRIANALERIAQALEHFNIEHAHIDEIDHNHVEGDVNTHNKTCLLYTSPSPRDRG